MVTITPPEARRLLFTPALAVSLKFSGKKSKQEYTWNSLRQHLWLVSRKGVGTVSYWSSIRRTVPFSYLKEVAWSLQGQCYYECRIYSEKYKILQSFLYAEGSRFSPFLLVRPTGLTKSEIFRKEAPEGWAAVLDIKWYFCCSDGLSAEHPAKFRGSWRGVRFCLAVWPPWPPWPIEMARKYVEKVNKNVFFVKGKPKLFTKKFWMQTINWNVWASRHGVIVSKII